MSLKTSRGRVRWEEIGETSQGYTRFKTVPICVRCGKDIEAFHMALAQDTEFCVRCSIHMDQFSKGVVNE